MLRSAHAKLSLQGGPVQTRFSDKSAFRPVVELTDWYAPEIPGAFRLFLRSLKSGAPFWQC